MIIMLRKGVVAVTVGWNSNLCITLVKLVTGLPLKYRATFEVLMNSQN